MIFANKEHEDFWNEKVKIMSNYGKMDRYYQSAIYTLGICKETREHFKDILNIEMGEININVLKESWQTSTSQKVTRMAFNLWNDCEYDSEEDIENEKVSNKYNVSNIFCCIYARYFCEAIKLRYPEYAKETEIKLEDYDREI